MAASLTAKYDISNTENLGIKCFKLDVTIIDSQGIPREVFVYRIKQNPYNEQSDEFMCVAGPNDIEELPANEPDLENEIPFYRTNKVTLFFRNADDLADVKDLIRSDLNELVKSYKALDNIQVSETEVYPL